MERFDDQACAACIASTFLVTTATVSASPSVGLN